MNITIDKNITLGNEAFSTLGNVNIVDGRNLTRENLKNTTALIVRSVTNVNEQLLKNTPVKFVATATIGTDHLDTDYLKSSGIKYFSAPGCNSTAVTEYILTAITLFCEKKNLKLNECSIGVIGVGNIGSKVAEATRLLGMKVVINDPPREKAEKSDMFSSIEAALSCDIITFHTPMIRTGEYKTLHLLNRQNIGMVKPGAIILNASRGGVAENRAILDRVTEQNDISVVLDVWENEPDISSELLRVVDIATPHIAGYSLEGKVNGTYTCYKNLCEFMGVPPSWKPDLPEIKENRIDVTGLGEKEALIQIFQSIYNMKEDDAALKNHSGDMGIHFDNLRKNYRVRRESKAYEIRTDNEVTAGLINYLGSI